MNPRLANMSTEMLQDSYERLVAARVVLKSIGRYDLAWRLEEPSREINRMVFDRAMADQEQKQRQLPLLTEGAYGLTKADDQAPF